MSLEKNILSFADFGRQKSGASAYGMRPSNRAFALPDFMPAPPKRTPQHLIGLLFAHGSRTRRACLPRTAIKMSVFTPAGKCAVKLRV